MANVRLLLLLSALAFIVYQVQSTNLILGNNAGSSLLFKNNATKKAVVGQTQTQDMVYRGFAVNITYIRAMEVGVTQNATATLVSGGLGRSNCTIRFKSALSRGYNYTVEIWGK